MSFDTGIQEGILRRNALVAAMRYTADAMSDSLGAVSPLQDEFDDAVKALAAKLNEPETCYACGQEKPSE